MYAIPLGVVTLVAAAATSWYGPMPPWYEMAGFCVAACMLGSRTIRLSRTLGTVSAGFIFVFATIVELGPVAGIIAGAASALGGTVLCPLVCRTKRMPRPTVVLAAVNSIVLAAAVAAWAYVALELVCEELGMAAMGVLPAFFAVGVYYLVNSFTVAMMASLAGDRSPGQIWLDNLSWTVLPFYLGGTVVVLVHMVALALGPLVWLALIPPVLAIHLVMDWRTKARVAQMLEGRRETS